MLSDKLSAREIHVARREEYGRIVADFQRRFRPVDGPKTYTFDAMLNDLLARNAELAQAPLLYTLQSAAEVGFAHSQPPRIVTKAPVEKQHAGNCECAECWQQMERGGR